MNQGGNAAVAAPIDLRSDLVTRPTPAMIREMVQALEQPAAYDLREDARQRQLEARIAEITGKEDALLFPTCTMANQAAIYLQCARGETVVAEADSHAITSEAGAPAALSGALVRPLPGQAGQIDLERLQQVLVSPLDALRSRIALIVLENTHNRAGGVPLPVDYHARVADLAWAGGAAVHLDGARLFNAAVALGCRPADITRHVNTVALSLNKGLSVPIGAMLAGPRDLIHRALRVRQMLGGGIRPTGFLAAAGLVALDTMVDGLAADHANARALAEGLGALAPHGLDVSAATNIVLIRTGRTGLTPQELTGALAARGVLVLPFGPTQMRLVVHRHIGPGEVAHVIAAFEQVVAGAGSPAARAAGPGTE